MGNISYEIVPKRRGGDGIAILSSKNNRIVNNSAVNNGPYSGSGVSSGNVLDGNLLQGSIQARTPNNVVNNNIIGILLEPGNTGNLIINKPGGRQRAGRHHALRTQHI